MPPVKPDRREQGRAIVIGGSMSGLFAGLMLRAAGWQVDVYEKVEGLLSGRGAGIVAQPEILEALSALGLDTRHLGVRWRSAGYSIHRGACCSKPIARR